MKCSEPLYEFCEYLDGEYKETDIRVRHNEAVTSFGNENELIKFKILLEAKVLSTLNYRLGMLLGLFFVTQRHVASCSTALFYPI